MRYTVVVEEQVTRWYKEGTEILHREGGPAVEWTKGVHAGAKIWWVDGLRHREDGPAIIYEDGSKYWCLNGECVSEEEFNRRTATAVEMTVEEISKRLGMNIKIVKG